MKPTLVQEEDEWSQCNLPKINVLEKSPEQPELKLEMSQI